jgi:DNA-binding NarL/FixJ family response regulator
LAALLIPLEPSTQKSGVNVKPSKNGDAVKANKARIAIVEDEGLIANDIQDRLISFGYDVVGIFTNGEEALEFLEHSNADLVLLDIHLPGVIDGIEVGVIARTRWNLPAIFLTAFSDTSRIARAARSKPGGYLLKPIRDRELFAAVELTLHRTAIERRVKESHEWFAKLAGPSVIGTIVFDVHGVVNFADSRAEALFQRPREEILGMELASLFRFGRGSTQSGTLGLFHDVATGRSARRSGQGYVLVHGADPLPVSYSLTPLLDSNGVVLGIVLALVARTGSEVIGTDLYSSDSACAASKVSTRIALVSIDPIFRRGFADLLRTSTMMDVTVELRSVQDLQAFDLVAKADVVVVDPNFLVQCSEDQLVSLESAFQALPIVVITSRLDMPSVVQAVRRGYSCLVLHGEDVDSLERILIAVASGETHISPELAPLLLSQMRSDIPNRALSHLSSRELKVLEGIQRGKLVKEIAAELNLSAKTVSTYRLRLLKKMGVKTNAELIKLLARIGRGVRS